MAGRKTFYITTPIYYPNDKLHIGHTYTTVAADSLARYHRLRGHDTWFLTGTDEHGLKLERAAREAGQKPIDYIDPIVDWIKELWTTLDIQYDDFIRTTEDRHQKRVQAIFQQLHDQGDIYKGEYRGLYCTDCEAFYTAADLLEGNLCPVHERSVESVAEESYFFRLSRYGDALLDYIESNPEFVQPESRRNEVVSFIRQGLDDLSVSRTSFTWGIPVPFDPNHVIYVWIDALANYVTALDYPDGDMYPRFWPADIHLIGKDILRFHAIIWPAILLALGQPLPRCVYGHGWLLLDGGKIGKSRVGGQVIDPIALVEKYGVDAVRYFLLREVPFGADGTYSEEALIRRINSDLANDLGNLVWRTISMIERFNGGQVPAPSPDHDDGVLADQAGEVFAKVEAALERFELNRALADGWDLVKRANKYIDEQAPWELNRRGEQERLHTVLYNVAEAIRLAGVLVSPFLVQTPGRIWNQVGLDQAPGDLPWDEVRNWGGLSPGLKVRKADPLFPRLDLDEILAAAAADTADGTPSTDQKRSSAAPEAGAPVKAKQADQALAEQALIEGNTIKMPEFQKIDLRVVRITAAEPVPGADRILCLQVALNEGKQRQVVAGIAQHYRIEDLIGRQAVLVANLAPATIRGIKSEGMLLAAEDGQSLALIGPETEIADGSRIR
ncbi:MAG: methionine--tRNA ligase [Thermaerobacterales bacterium]